ncbi:MAG TPA: cysteine--tRNA ligase [Nevskiaceae bacterium]|nr:cysteine--tRNA ligase [Nevskiaceae bacterium]
MKLHNTLTRNVENITPLRDNIARIYSCGPTVYDHAHIGNLSAYIFADTLRRSLQLAGYTTKHVMNYTDVDDKTIRRSHEQYPHDEPMQALRKLTDHYIQLFNNDMDRLGNDIAAVTFVRATDHIGSMKELTRRLYERGFAYLADDGVYFSIEAYQKSGKTYGQLLELTPQNTSEARIKNDEYDKDNIHDFALWKKQKSGEPAWDFELDGQDMTGRPGWHIECSAMSRDELDQPFDIHTGGVDLIFPHHENEIAQSTALTIPTMAQSFVHNEHILVDGKKMAKSAQNFYTLQDIIDKGFDPIAFRLLVLQAHYRSQAHFSWDNLEAAQNRLQKYRAFADLLWELPDTGKSSDPNLLNDAKNDIISALQNDIDTPHALARLSDTEGQWLRVLSSESKETFKPFLEFIDQALGLNLSHTKDITDTQYELIHRREQARRAKDWKQSDDLRNQLKEQGIGVRDDTPGGDVWYRL